MSLLVARTGTEGRRIWTETGRDEEAGAGQETPLRRLNGSQQKRGMNGGRGGGPASVVIEACEAYFHYAHKMLIYLLQGDDVVIE